MAMKLHPATVLLLWATVAVLLQQIPLLPLLLCVGVGLALTALRWPVRSLSVLRRVRWLLLTTAMLFVWGSPGEYISWLPGATYEGLQQGLRHLACLILFLVMLIGLLEMMGTTQLISAMHALAAPLRYLGFNRDRAAIRLLLVLEYLEQPVPAGGWRAMLSGVGKNEHMDVPADLPALTLNRHEWRWLDGVLLGTAVLLLGAL